MLRRSNRLLAALSPRLSARLIAACDGVDLKLGTVLNEADARIAHVYFPTEGFVSLMIPVDGTSNLEVGLVGNEGMVGTPLILGMERSPLRALVQGAGPAWRMSARTFTRELGLSAALRTLLHGICKCGSVNWHRLPRAPAFTWSKHGWPAGC